MTRITVLQEVRHMLFEALLWVATTASTHDGGGGGDERGTE